MYLSVLYVCVYTVLINVCYAQIDKVNDQGNKENGLTSKETEEITETPKSLDDLHVTILKFLDTLKAIEDMDVNGNKTQEINPSGSLIKKHSINEQSEGRNVDVRLKRSSFGKCRRCGRRKHKCDWCGGYGGSETIGYIPIQRPIQYNTPHHQPNYGCQQCGGGGGRGYYPSGGGQQYSYSQASASASSGSYGRR